jgi:flagellar motor switch protein FliN
MDWQTLSWKPADAPELAGAAAFAPNVPLMQSALEEAIAGAILGPASITGFSVATVADPATLEPEFTALASFEFLGASRRGAWVALDTSQGDALAGQALSALDLGGVLTEAADQVFEQLLGEGLGFGASNTVPPFPTSDALLVRLDLEATAGGSVGLVFLTDAAVPAELGAHVMALQVLSGDLTPPATAAAPAQPVPSIPSAAAAPTPTPAPARPTPMAPQPAAARPAPVAAQPGPMVQVVDFDQLPARGIVGSGGDGSPNIDLLLGVNLEVSVEIGRTRLPIREILALAPGSIVELDKLAGEAVNVLVNGRTIASGEVVVVDENFGVRITSIASRQRRITSAGAA